MSSPVKLLDIFLSDWPLEHGGPEAKKLFVNFVVMALCFSINHGTVGALINLSTSLLGTGLGSVNLGTLWFMYVLTALTLATTIIGMFGAKGGLIAGTGGYCVYVFSFALAALVSATPPTEAELIANPDSCVAAGAAAMGPGPPSGSSWCALTRVDMNADPPPVPSCECQATSLVKTVSLVGAMFGGIAAGFLWTAQGAYFARNAELYAEAGGRIFGSDTTEVTTARATGLFSSIFAALYLSFEVVMKLLSSLLPAPVQLPFYALAAASSAAGLVLIRALPPAAPPVQKPLLQKIGTASSLLVSYRPIQLLAPTEMVFGFSAAMMNAWVNGELVSCAQGCVGGHYIGYFGTLTTVVAALASFCAGWYTTQKEGGVFRGKTPVMLGGNGAFGLLGLIVLLFPVASFYGSFAMLVPLYLLQGIGRGIFESTNKAVIADYCPGARSEAGFASFVILSGAASTIMFFIIPLLKAPRACVPHDPSNEADATTSVDGPLAFVSLHLLTCLLMPAHAACSVSRTGVARRWGWTWTEQLAPARTAVSMILGCQTLPTESLFLLAW